MIYDRFGRLYWKPGFLTPRLDEESSDWGRGELEGGLWSLGWENQAWRDHSDRRGIRLQESGRLCSAGHGHWQPESCYKPASLRHSQPASHHIVGIEEPHQLSFLLDHCRGPAIRNAPVNAQRLCIVPIWLACVDNSLFNCPRIKGHPRHPYLHFCDITWKSLKISLLQKETHSFCTHFSSGIDDHLSCVADIPYCWMSSTCLSRYTLCSSSLHSLHQRLISVDFLLVSVSGEPGRRLDGQRAWGQDIYSSSLNSSLLSSCNLSFSLFLPIGTGSNLCVTSYLRI